LPNNTHLVLLFLDLAHHFHPGQLLNLAHLHEDLLLLMDQHHAHTHLLTTAQPMALLAHLPAPSAHLPASPVPQEQLLFLPANSVVTAVT
jgi:hypothetical protein